MKVIISETFVSINPDWTYKTSLMLIRNMKSRRSPIQSALEDVSKEPEPPPKPIFCCMRNLRNSIVLTTFCIAPNSKIVEATFRFCGKKRKKPPEHTFLGRKVNQAVSFLLLPEYSSMTNMFVTSESSQNYRHYNPALLNLNICNITSQLIHNPGI